MLVQQHITVQPEAKPRNHFSDELQKMLAVAFIPENRFAFVAARAPMIPALRLLDA